VEIYKPKFRRNLIPGLRSISEEVVLLGGHGNMGIQASVSRQKTCTKFAAWWLSDIIDQGNGGDTTMARRKLIDSAFV